ncbi:ABC transporter permease [Oceanispirochaeta crateris]|uniref:ABC transporter permease n=1 Tax=Oceanispirochaeta crateris TaxID=2518645 RepID=A0A5C1QKB9_9SPIO|nr:ABC transporter permease [Oceanispirochaeta crateris]QEN07460.1 ABC transporter permease [Oceanispirochaeta crateris]
MKWTSSLSSRYLFTHNGRKGHLGNTLAVLGLSIGIMTLITVLTVMNGFQQGFITSINEIYSYHIRISLEEPEDYEKFQIKDIRSAVPFTDQQGILTTPRALNSGGQIRFLDFKAAENDTAFHEQINIIEGRFPANSHEIILGSYLARYLAVLPGETLQFSFLNPSTTSFENRELKITGIFNSGYYEYDRNLAFSNLSGFSNNSLIVGIKLNNHFRDRNVIKEIKASYPDLNPVSWREYNSAFFNALKIEKVFMFLIVALIFIVVAVNIYHSMKRNVKERIAELALLKAIGGTPKDIRSIYTNQGIMISLISTVAGTTLGIILSSNINEIITLLQRIQYKFYEWSQFIPWSQNSVLGEFYFTEIPIQFFWQDILTINVSAFLTVLIAAYASIKRASRILPSEIFRNE